MDSKPELPLLKRCVWGKAWGFKAGCILFGALNCLQFVGVLSKYICFCPLHNPQVNDQICTVELPEAEVKKWWAKNEWRVFVQEFQERHPSAKQMAKDMPKTPGPGAAGVLIPSRKRHADYDMTKDLVDVGSEPGSVKIKSVHIMNCRLPTDAKSKAFPTLVVSDGGPYIQHDTENPVPW